MVHEAWKARGTALDVATAEGPLAALPLGTKKIQGVFFYNVFVPAAERARACSGFGTQNQSKVS